MIEPIPTKPGARDQLMSDLKSVIQDAESWLRSSTQMTGEELQAARAKFERTLSSAKADLIRIEETVVAKTKEAAKATDEYVHENPWKAVGIGAAAGLVIGMLISRK
ncbi:MAG: YqjD family protein [Massilia sp.]